MSKLKYSIIPVGLLAIVCSTFGATETDISRLRKDLLVGYDKYSRPIQNHHDTTVVRVNFVLKGFELDERVSTLTVFAWTILVWEDQHMKWDPKNYSNLTRIHFSAHELWQPDLMVYNNLDKSEIDHFGNTRVIVNNTSHVVWVPPTKFQVGCQTDLRKWPFDQQRCTIIIGSWAHDVIAAAILIAFWLPPGSTERLSIILITILINVLYLYYIYSAIPNNGDSVPLVVLYYRDSLIMLAYALIWTICLRYLAATRRNSPVPLPGFIQSFLESVPAKILCLNPKPSTGGRRENPESADNNEQTDGTGNGHPFGNDKKNPFQEDWAWLAHLLDRVAFVIYFMVYMIFYLALL